MKTLETTVGFLTTLSPQDFKALISDSVAAGIAAATASNRATDKAKAEGEGYMSRKEAAEFLHISLQTLNEKMRAGELTGFRLGGRVLYKRSDLEAALVSTSRYTIAGKKRGPKPKNQAAA
ncbi:MAG: helix-turn-helix domain-containing protein [Janthinobacterium lividum]